MNVCKKDDHFLSKIKRFPNEWELICNWCHKKGEGVGQGFCDVDILDSCDKGWVGVLLKL